MSEPEVLVEFGDDRLGPTQRAVRSAAFLQLLETGEPASIVTVSRRSGTSERAVVEVLEDLGERGSVQLSNRYVLGIAGLSITPTRHTIALSHGERWTWCALDAIGIVGALGAGVIHSRASGRAVTLTFENGVFRPEGMAILLADGYGRTKSIGEWCALVDFFPDTESAERWAEQNDVGGRGLGVASLAPLASKRWRSIIGDDRGSAQA